MSSNLPLAISWMSWHEANLFGALAAEAQARDLQDIQEDAELNPLAVELVNVALRRFLFKSAPVKRPPIETGFRSLREVHEYGLRAALYMGVHSRRLFPRFDDLNDLEAERLWGHVEAIITTTGRTQKEMNDAEALSRRILLGVHQMSWPVIAAIVDSNRVAENGGPPADYDDLLDYILKQQEGKPSHVHDERFGHPPTER